MNIYEQCEINVLIIFRNYTLGGTVNLNKLLVASITTTVLQLVLSNGGTVEPEITVNTG
jgi:hypothetical protein